MRRGQQRGSYPSAQVRAHSSPTPLDRRCLTVDTSCLSLAHRLAMTFREGKSCPEVLYTCNLIAVHPSIPLMCRIITTPGGQPPICQQMPGHCEHHCCPSTPGTHVSLDQGSNVVCRPAAVHRAVAGADHARRERGAAAVPLQPRAGAPHGRTRGGGPPGDQPPHPPAWRRCAC